MKTPPQLPLTHQKRSAVVVALILAVLTTYASTLLYGTGHPNHWPLFWDVWSMLLIPVAGIFFSIYFKSTQQYFQSARLTENKSKCIINVLVTFTALWWLPLLLMIAWAFILLTFFMFAGIFS